MGGRFLKPLLKDMSVRSLEEWFGSTCSLLWCNTVVFNVLNLVYSNSKGLDDLLVRDLESEQSLDL